MRFVIVTGMSGAGHSSAMRILEDAGYFCVDNLPITLLSTFMQLTVDSSEEIEKVALGIDVRAGQEAFKNIDEKIAQLKASGFVFEILFLEASKDVLIKRYKETRRMHPLSKGGRVDSGVDEERELLAGMKKSADIILDTSTLLIRDLKKELDRIFLDDKKSCNLYLIFISFGYKYGIPSDADLVFDVRFLPNPFYIDELKPLTGNDRPVSDFVMNHDNAKEFLKKFKDMLDFLIPNYVIEGKTQLVVAVGCTGGKHRSVTLVNEIFKEFESGDYGCKKEHRDIEKDRLRKNVVF